MAITPRASTTLALATRTNTTVSRPAGTTTGDYIVVALTCGGSSAATITAPSGWTQLATITYSNTDPWSVVLQLWGRFDDGAASWTWTHASRSSQAYATAYTGVDPATPVDVAATTAGVNNTAAGSTIAAPSQTIVTAGARGIIARGSWDGNAITGPAGWSERLDAPVLWVGDRDWSAAGATGTVTVPTGNTGTDARAILMAALRPAGTGPAQVTAAGAISWAGSATTKRVPKVTGSGAIGWAGSATAKREPKITASGAVSWAGSATIKRVPKITGAGAVAYSGEAQIARPSLITAAGAIDWAGTVTTEAQHLVTGFGTWSLAGEAIIGRPSLVEAAGAITWAGEAIAARQPLVQAEGSITWAGLATVDAPPDTEPGRDLIITALTPPTVGWSTNQLTGSQLSISPITTAWGSSVPAVASATTGPANESTIAATGPVSGTSTTPPGVAATTTGPTT